VVEEATPINEPEPLQDQETQRQRLPQEAQDNVDLADIVDTIEMIKDLIQPYARLVAMLRWLIGWESVYWSGSVLAGLVLGCIVCPGLLLCGLAAGPALAMVVARFRRVPEGRGAYFDPTWQVSADAYARATVVPDKLEATQMTLQKYYTYLLNFQSTADEFCEWLIDNHKLWNWSEPARSVRLIASCMVVTVALLFLPTNYGLASITCLIFYGGWEPSTAGENRPEMYSSVYEQQQQHAGGGGGGGLQSNGVGDAGSGWVHVKDNGNGDREIQLRDRDRTINNSNGNSSVVAAVGVVGVLVAADHMAAVLTVTMTTTAEAQQQQEVWESRMMTSSS